MLPKVPLKVSKWSPNVCAAARPAVGVKVVPWNPEAPPYKALKVAVGVGEGPTSPNCLFQPYYVLVGRAKLREM